MPTCFEAGMSNSGTKEPSPQPSTAQSPPEPQRRGRGRPRKQQQEPVGPPTPKRPRGRPKGSKNKGPRTALKKVEPVGERRPRGRPRKWPQKVVQEAPEEQQNINGIDEDVMGSWKRTVGRAEFPRYTSEHPFVTSSVGEGAPPRFSETLGPSEEAEEGPSQAEPSSSQVAAQEEGE